MLAKKPLSVFSSAIACFSLICSVGSAAIAPPVISPLGGEALTGFRVTVSCATPGARMYYTLNGAEPGLFDFPLPADGSISFARNLTVKVKAWKDLEVSTTTAGTYILTGDVAAGIQHSLSLSTSGTVKAWGLQTNGRLGNGLTTSAVVASPTASLYPGTIPVLDASFIAAGEQHSVFLRNGGSVWSFGPGSTLGNGVATGGDVSSAVQVRTSTNTDDMLTNCVAVGAGGYYSAALSSSGEVYTWGYLAGGSLGYIPLTNPARFASKVERGDLPSYPFLSNINRIAVGKGEVFYGYTLAKEPSSIEVPGGLGRVWAWGTNSSGQLGQGDNVELSRAFPVKLNATTLLSDVWDVSCGTNHSAVVRWKTGDPALQGSVMCFGQQGGGALGNNLSTSLVVTYPVGVVKADSSPLLGITSVAAGSGFTLALDLNGNVWAWGGNYYGSLGDNTTVSRGFAAKVLNPLGTGDLQNIIKISASGTGSSFAVASDGSVYAWGRNASGQLGKAASTTPTKLPEKIVGLSLSASPPEVTLATTVTSNVFPGGATITASPTSTNATTSMVEFYCQGSFIGQATAAPWTISLTNLTQGSYHSFAVATDSNGLKGYSPAADFVVAYSSALETLDLDGDGLNGLEELAVGTSPTDADTDGDGIPDGAEAPADRLVPASIPLGALTSNIFVWSPTE